MARLANDRKAAVPQMTTLYSYSDQKSITECTECPSMLKLVADKLQQPKSRLVFTHISQDQKPEAAVGADSPNLGWKILAWLLGPTA